MLESTSPAIPKILVVHNGRSVNEQVRYLRDAGLDVMDARAVDAVMAALAFTPQIIILDYDCAGEVLAVLKADPRTEAIPVIGLRDLQERR